MTTDNTDTFLTVNEAAELVRVSPSSIYEALRRGLPGRKMGKQWRISRAELLAYFRGSQHTPALAEAVAPAVAAEVSKAIGEAMVSVGQKLISEAKRR
jgi:excisionase family DNA binding protein